MKTEYDLYRVLNVRHVTYNGKDHTFFALYIYDNEHNAFIYDHTEHIKGHYKTKTAILNRHFKDKE